MNSILDVQSVTMRFSGLTAISKFSLTLLPGELVGLIGPNGAGKTTVFNLLSAMYAPTEGDIRLYGESTVALKPHEVVERGMARTFQNIRLFKKLTVLENALIGHHRHLRYGILATLFRSPDARLQEKRARDEVMLLLDRFGLRDKLRRRAGELPYGEQKRLEMVRALATEPKVLLLDEPAAGLNHTETEALMRMIQSIRKEFELTIVLIEHDMRVVMGMCERILVLDHGETIAQGTQKEIQRNPLVIKAYLGCD